MSSRDDVDARVEVQDGRVSIAAGGPLRLLVATPDRRPLGRNQRHATVSLVSDDVDVETHLDADEAEWLRDQLDDALGSDGDGMAGPQAADGFAWNCRDCGFIGTWLTIEGTCPECGGRDLPTERREQ